MTNCLRKTFLSPHPHFPNHVSAGEFTPSTTLGSTFVLELRGKDPSSASTSQSEEKFLGKSSYGYHVVVLLSQQHQRTFFGPLTNVDFRVLDGQGNVTLFSEWTMVKGPAASSNRRRADLGLTGVPSERFPSRGTEELRSSRHLCFHLCGRQHCTLRHATDSHCNATSLAENPPQINGEHQS